MPNIKQKALKSKWHHVVLVKYWMILIVFIAIAVFVSEYFFIIKPKLDLAVNGGLLDIGTHQQILVEQEEYLAKLTALKQEEVNINIEELKKLDYVLANSAEMPAILRQINALAVQSRLNLLGFNVWYDNGEILMNFTFKGGDYESIKEYLRAIEKNIRIMDVDNLVIKELGNIFSVSIKSYYLD